MTLVGEASLAVAVPALSIVVVLLVESTLFSIVGSALLDLIDRGLSLRPCRTSELVLLTGLLVLVLIESAIAAVALISAAALRTSASAVAALAALTILAAVTAAASCRTLPVTACICNDRRA